MKKRDYYPSFKKDSRGHSSNRLKSVWENVENIGRKNFKAALFIKKNNTYEGLDPNSTIN